MVVKEEKAIKTLRKVFGADPTNRYTKFYEYGGWRQSKRKREFMEIAKLIEKERGIPCYHPGIGVPLGQRLLEPIQISGTDVICEYEDVHHINNPAIQQMIDDIKRTAIIGLGTPHMILKIRLGKDVTPETINNYMEIVNHTMPGGAVAQEHMVEINPGLVKDCYVKLITGNDELADEIDSRFLIDINKLFPRHTAEKLKEAIGDKIFQVTRIPTIVVRNSDGGVVHRWNAMQTSMAFISAYKLTGEAAIADFAFAAKHAEYIFLGTPTWRDRAQNELGGIPYGYYGDICQADVNDVLNYLFQCGTILATLEQMWWFNYMSGGVGTTIGFTSTAYVNNVSDDFLRFAYDFVDKEYGLARMKPDMDLIKDITFKVASYCMDLYDSYPVMCEFHWSGVLKSALIAAICGQAVALATGNAQAGTVGFHLASLYIKERWGRLGWAAHEMFTGSGFAHIYSMCTDEGTPMELRGNNYHLHSYIAGNGVNAIFVATAHAARGDAWCLSPMVKVAFADPDLIFDFRNPRKAIAKGALRTFKPAGERGLVSPSE